MEYFLIYLLVMADNLQGAASGLFIGGGLIWLCVACPIGASITSNDPPPKPVMKWFKISGVTIACAGLLGTLLPTTKQLAVIIGGGAVIEVVTSDKGKEVAGKIGSALEEKLYEILSVKDK